MFDPISTSLTVTGTIAAVILANRIERRSRLSKMYPKERGVKRNKFICMFGFMPIDFKQPTPYDPDNPEWRPE